MQAFRRLGIHTLEPEPPHPFESAQEALKRYAIFAGRRFLRCRPFVGDPAEVSDHGLIYLARQLSIAQSLIALSAGNHGRPNDMVVVTLHRQNGHATQRLGLLFEIVQPASVQ